MGTVPDGTIIDFYVSTRAWASAHPDAARGFHDALEDARAFIKANDAKSREILAKWTKQPAPVIASTVIPNFRGDITPAQVDFWIDLVKKQGLLTTTPSGADFIFKPKG
jgi:NitT/TauT family transport system substrate-binding protein